MKLRVIRNKKADKNKKKKHTLRYITLGVVFFAFMIYAVYSIATTNQRIAEKQELYDNILNEIEIQEIKNSELEEVLNYSDEEYLEYVISKARSDLDYVKQGERVFVNSSGD